VLRVIVPTDPSFRFDFALHYLRRSSDEVVDIVRDGSHHRVLRTTNGLALIRISEATGEAESAIQAQVVAGNASGDDVQAVVERLYPREQSASIEGLTEPLALQLRKHFQGLPVVQTLSPWEALVWAVLGQQINIAFAYRLKRRFVEYFGDSLVHDGSTYYAFPTPERVALLDHERDLRPIQFSRQKSRYIIEAARSVVDGTLDLDQIESLDDEAASLALQRQLGIGRWTAEYILLRGYARLDVIPAGDAALKTLVGSHLELGRSATEDEVRDIAEQWKPRRGEIGFMLWFAKQAGFFEP